MTSALLLVVAMAYLAGAFLVVAALAKVLGAWATSWRTRRHAEPVAAALNGRAAAAMAAVAALANVTPPATDVVAYLGAPTGDDARPVGDGGLAVTHFRAGHPTVVFAQSALTSLSPAAVQSLAAHELAHVIRRERSSVAARYGWLVCYLALVLAGAALTVAPLVAAPQMAGPALLATMSAAVAFLTLQIAFDRREEIAADRFAVALTPRPRGGRRADAVLRYVRREAPPGRRSRSRVGAVRAPLVRDPPGPPGAARSDASAPS